MQPHIHACSSHCMIARRRDEDGEQGQEDVTCIAGLGTARCNCQPRNGGDVDNTAAAPWNHIASYALADQNRGGEVVVEDGLHVDVGYVNSVVGLGLLATGCDIAACAPSSSRQHRRADGGEGWLSSMGKSCCTHRRCGRGCRCGRRRQSPRRLRGLPGPGGPGPPARAAVDHHMRVSTMIEPATAHRQAAYRRHAKLLADCSCSGRQCGPLTEFGRAVLTPSVDRD